MPTPENLSLLEHFGNVEDPRVPRQMRHKFLDIIGVAICGVICGAENWAEIERFGQAKIDWLRTFLELPNGIPSHDTFGRVFGAVDAKAFQMAFRAWVEATRFSVARSSQLMGSVCVVLMIAPMAKRPFRW